MATTHPGSAEAATPEATHVVATHFSATSLGFTKAPYPGLRPFRPSEPDIFFGRERQTGDLLSRLAAHRFLAVVGPSGCGKSSLIAAGLMPALTAGFVAKAGARWRVAYLKPGKHPIRNLAEALINADVLDAARAAQPDARFFLEAALRRGPLSLVEIVRSSALAADTNLLLFIDQFEELFRFSSSAERDEAEAFVALVVGSASAPDERLYITLTMRSDFLDECTPFHRLPEAINDGLYLTPRLTREECSACITGPARVFDADVDPALVNRLLNDFGPDPDQLPLLQHALMRMWNRHADDRESGKKTILAPSDYDAIGGLARSLSDHVNEAFDELAPADRRIAELMFRRLSDSETTGDRRAPARVGEIAELCGAGIADVRRVAEVFRQGDRSFLLLGESAQPADAILDVSHESLLRQWDKAAGWIKEEAEDVRLYRRLNEAAREWRRGSGTVWSASHHDRAVTWQRKATAVWARRYGTDEDFALVRDFIAAGEHARRKARFARWRRVGGIALVVLAVFAIGAWITRLLLYEWTHTSYYASRGGRYGAPYGLGELTAEQRDHRPVSYRVVRAGVRGRVEYIEAVNGRGQVTEVAPEYLGGEHGRPLATSRWTYEYDAGGQVASEHQYTALRRGSHRSLVQGKIYIPVKTEHERTALFIGTDGTPIPVRGRSEDSAHYWAETLSSSTTSTTYTETIQYLGSSGEPAPGDARAFATTMVYGRQGDLLSITSLDASGQPMNDTQGNATMEFSNDAFGNALESSARDSEGRRTHIKDGWAIRRLAFDAYGNEIATAYFDDNEKPIATREGWHKATYKRDDHGEITETRYFDQEMRPTVDVAYACYGTSVQHDAMGRLIRWTCLDSAGAPRKTRFGYVTSTSLYDDSGRLVEERTLDADGRPTAGEDAYARTLYRYDDDGRCTQISYLGADGKPVISSAGYATARSEYRDAGRTEWTRFLDADGKPVVVKDGHASVKRKRDVFWNVIEEHYLDQSAGLTITSDGTAGWRGTFDARGQQIESVYLNTADEAVLSKYGYSGWTAEYDQLGRPITARFVDPAGKPTLTVAEGIASWTSRYDRWGNVIEHRYFGTDGSALNSIHGDAGWRADYDARGNRTKLQYIDSLTQPALHVWDDDAKLTNRGYAALETTFDAHGNLLEEAYFGTQGERVARPDGWSFAKHEYDDYGRQKTTSYFGIKGEPVRVRGYHVVARSYDDRGNAVETRYLDIDRSPVVSNEGFARIVKSYDAYHRVVEQTVFGLHDEPVTMSDGSYRAVTTWDDHGRVTKKQTWGVKDPENTFEAVEYHYDSWGNLAKESHVDPAGQPVAKPAAPCATKVWRFDDKQQLEKMECYDATGARSPHLDNAAASIAYAYDAHRQKMKESYLDKDDRRFTTKAGYASIKYKYDLQGREIERTYLDRDNDQTLTKLGYARVETAYDLRGNPIEKSYFLENDSPTRPVARVESEYNALGWKIVDLYWGPAGKRALLRGNGQNQTLYKYDELGNLQELRYLDAHGRPARGYAADFDDSWRLCGRWVARYGADGKLAGNGECLPDIPAPTRARVDLHRDRKGGGRP